MWKCPLSFFFSNEGKSIHWTGMVVHIIRMDLGTLIEYTHWQEEEREEDKKKKKEKNHTNTNNNFSRFKRF